MKKPKEPLLDTDEGNPLSRHLPDFRMTSLALHLCASAGFLLVFFAAHCSVGTGFDCFQSLSTKTVEKPAENAVEKQPSG